MWYLMSPARLQTEREALGDLEAREPWLRKVRWRLDAGAVLVDAEIHHAGKAYEVVVRYHEGFPDIPPSIFPLKKELWSSHQYGMGGELCLEYGADNWVPQLTGADLLKSAYKLLVLESAEATAPSQVPSRHSLSVGQTSRLDILRLVVSHGYAQHIKGLVGSLPATFVTLFSSKNCVAIAQALSETASEWTDPSVPDGTQHPFQTIKGFFVATPGSGLPTIDLKIGASAVREILLGSPAAVAADASEIIVAVAGETMRMYFLTPQGSAYSSDAIVIGEEVERSAGARHQLSGRPVAILGAGSLGSKVAASLCRSGVDSFVLFDEQILEPGNLERHDLDWQSVGIHKVDALAARLKLINPKANVQVRTLLIGGQESSSSVASALKQLRDCELIVEATASPSPFNLAAAAARSAKRAMIWGEVFQGGIGGFVARSRPTNDPSPLVGRNRILQWCADKGLRAPPRPVHPYGGTEGQPLTADDADVMGIATHMVRMALDYLRRPTASDFPHSAYMIGLRADWLFSEPFETHPIDMGPAEPVDSDASNEALTAKGIESILQLIKETGATSTEK